MAVETPTRRVLVAGSSDVFRPHLLSLLREERLEIIEVDREPEARAWIRTKLVDVAIMEQSIFEDMVMSNLSPTLTAEPPLPVVVCASGGGDLWNEPENSEDLIVLPDSFTKKDLMAALRTVRRDEAHGNAVARDRRDSEDHRLELLGRLAAGVVHDFNNLLTVILGAGDVLATATPKDSPQRVFIEQIQQAAQKSATLIQQLKTLGRNQAPQHRRLDLNQALARAQSLVRNLAGKAVDIEMDLAQDLDDIEADPAQIEQIVMNLTLNAKDAMPHGGTLRMSTARLTLTRPINVNNGIPPGDYVVLTVSDTGTGMDQRTLRHLFEPFFTTKSHGRGSGLGLVNVQSILSSCGGHVAVSSKLNEGTTFTLFFPRASDTRQAC